MSTLGSAIRQEEELEKQCRGKAASTHPGSRGKVPQQPTSFFNNDQNNGVANTAENVCSHLPAEDGKGNSRHKEEASVEKKEVCTPKEVRKHDSLPLTRTTECSGDGRGSKQPEKGVPEVFPTDQPNCSKGKDNHRKRGSSKVRAHDKDRRGHREDRDRNNGKCGEQPQHSDENRGRHRKRDRERPSREKSGYFGDARKHGDHSSPKNRTKESGSSQDGSKDRSIRKDGYQGRDSSRVKGKTQSCESRRYMAASENESMQDSTFDAQSSRRTRRDLRQRQSRRDLRERQSRRGYRPFSKRKSVCVWERSPSPDLRLYEKVSNGKCLPAMAKKLKKKDKKANESKRKKKSEQSVKSRKKRRLEEEEAEILEAVRAEKEGMLAMFIQRGSPWRV